MYDFLDKIGLKAVLEAIKGKIPTSLPANGGNADYATNAGNADTVGNKHYTDFSQNAVLLTIEQVNDPNLESGIYSAENVYMSFPSDVASSWYMLIVNKHRATAGYGTQIAIPYDNGGQRGTFYRICRAGNWGNWIRIADGGNADTLDGLHADDFVNATNRNSTIIPSNADVPAWIYANGKRYQLYVTNSDNIGLTNVPNNSVDWVWYWFDGVNIIAREWATGKYYICDTINGVFSGWKDIYTSGYKPYVTGSVTITNMETTITTNHGFIPSAVFWWKTGGLIGNNEYVLNSAVEFTDSTITINYVENSSSGTNWKLHYIMFK